MFKFKKYPPNFIPVRHWQEIVSEKGEVVYHVIPTFINWIKGKSSPAFESHFPEFNHKPKYE